MGMNDVICYAAQIDQSNHKLLVSKHYLANMEKEPEVIFEGIFPFYTAYLCSGMGNNGELAFCNNDLLRLMIFNPLHNAVQILTPEVQYHAVTELIGYSDNSWVVYCKSLKAKDENNSKTYYDTFF